MHELSKSIARRLATPGFVRWFAGEGIDIGAGPDGLHVWRSLFPLMKSCRAWDQKDGDAQRMEHVPDATFDFVHSSHCLEHMRDPVEALSNWWRILRPNGHLVVIVPDEDLYEQALWPSAFNSDHKRTFTLWKPSRHATVEEYRAHASWSPASVNVLDLVTRLAAEGGRPLLIQRLEHTYRFERPPEDQTLNAVTESAIEFVLRKEVQTSAGGGRA